MRSIAGSDLWGPSMSPIDGIDGDGSHRSVPSMGPVCPGSVKRAPPRDRDQLQNHSNHRTNLNGAPPEIPIIYIHLHSSTFIYTHLHSSTFFHIQLQSSTYIYIQLHSSTLIYMHLHSSSFIDIHLRSSTFYYIHPYKSIFMNIVIHSSTRIYTELLTWP